MEEKKFFEYQGVIVTNARFITGDQTFAMSGITSVKSSRQDPSRSGPIVSAIIGLLFIAAALPNVYQFQQATPGVAVIGIIILVGAIIYAFGQKTEFSVLLTTASGEVKALASRDGEFIPRVVRALNDSIVYRG